MPPATLVHAPLSYTQRRAHATGSAPPLLGHSHGVSWGPGGTLVFGSRTVHIVHVEDPALARATNRDKLAQALCAERTRRCFRRAAPRRRSARASAPHRSSRRRRRRCARAPRREPSYDRLGLSSAHGLLRKYPDAGEAKNDFLEPRHSPSVIQTHATDGDQ